MTEKRKQYLRNYQREWVAKRKRDWLFDKQCVKCGSKERLEIDHTDPKTKSLKLKNITNTFWSWTWARINEELAKCQVLCHDCHMVKTLNERPKTSHGTIQMYKAHGCRCKLCWQKVRDEDRAYKKRRKERDKLSSENC